MTVSGPTLTSASMTQVSGRKMVTPAAMRRLGGGEAHGGVEVHHLGDGVGAEDFVDGVGLDGDDALAFGDEHGGDVGEVELAVGVVGVERVEFGEEGAGFEAVDAGVDLGCRELVRAEGFLFDDGDDFGSAFAGARGRGRSRWGRMGRR